MEKNYEKPTIMNLKEIEILNKCLEFKSDILDFLVAEARHCEHPSDIYKALVAVDKAVKETDTPSRILIAISKDKIDVAETAANKTEEIPLIKEILSKAERISENYKAVYCVTVKSESITLSKLENRNVSLEDAEKSYSLEEIEDGYRIRQYFGYANHVAIPEMIDGKPIVAIGEMAFAYRKHLALVVIPVTTTIEDAAFYDCDDVEIKVDRVSSENRYRNLEEDTLWHEENMQDYYETYIFNVLRTDEAYRFNVRSDSYIVSYNTFLENMLDQSFELVEE